MLRAFTDAYPATRVRIIGEPIWPGRSSLEYPACAQHEALINPAFQGREATILCPYDADRLEERVLADAYATHPLIVSGPSQHPSPSFAPGHIVELYNQPLGPVPTSAQSREFGARELSATRHFAVECAAQLGLQGVRLEDLALAVAELTTNSVIHGAVPAPCECGRRTLRWCARSATAGI